MICGLCYNHKLHGHMSKDTHFCVINIPNVHSHGKMSVITDILPGRYKIELIFSINYGHIVTAKIRAWKIKDILPRSQTNVSECVYYIGSGSSSYADLKSVVGSFSKNTYNTTYQFSNLNSNLKESSWNLKKQVLFLSEANKSAKHLKNLIFKLSWCIIVLYKNKNIKVVI